MNIKPQNVGDWNGWDTIATLDAFMNRGSGGSSIANTLFYASRSNQVSQSAQDWQTWKRWALDHKDFDQYKKNVIETINLHNNKVTADIEEQIRKVELNIQTASKLLTDPDAKEYISELIKKDDLKKRKQQKAWGYLVVFVIGIISIFSIVLNQEEFKDKRKQLGYEKIGRLRKEFMMNEHLKKAESLFSQGELTRAYSPYIQAMKKFPSELYPTHKDIIIRYLISRMLYRRYQLQSLYSNNKCDKDQEDLYILLGNRSIKKQVAADLGYWKNVINKICDQYIFPTYR